MRKIKLELESLAVESFDTAGERGTVLAQSLTLTPSGERTCETQETELSLDGTCVRAVCASVAVPFCPAP